MDRLTVKETRIRYESYTKNLLCFIHIFHKIRRQLFSGPTGLTIKIHGMWMVVPLIITASTPIGDLCSWSRTPILWDTWRMNTKANYTGLPRSSCNMGRMQTNVLFHIYNGMLFLQRRVISLTNSTPFRAK